MRQASPRDVPERAPGGPGAEDPRPASDAPEPDPGLADLLASLVEHLREVAGSFVDLLWLEGARARVGLRRGLALALLATGAGIVLLVACSVAAAQMVVGLVEAATALCAGRAWAGRLLGGALFLGLTALGIALVRRAAERRRVRARMRADGFEPGEPR